MSSESKHRSNLFVGLNFFLSQLAMHGVGSAAECFRTGSKMQVFSPKEIGDYDRCVYFSFCTLRFNPSLLSLKKNEFFCITSSSLPILRLSITTYLTIMYIKWVNLQRQCRNWLYMYVPVLVGNLCRKRFFQLIFDIIATAITTRHQSRYLPFCFLS